MPIFAVFYQGGLSTALAAALATLTAIVLFESIVWAQSAANAAGASTPGQPLSKTRRSPIEAVLLAPAAADLERSEYQLLDEFGIKVAVEFHQALG